MRPSRMFCNIVGTWCLVCVLETSSINDRNGLKWNISFYPIRWLIITVIGQRRDMCSLTTSKVKEGLETTNCTYGIVWAKLASTINANICSWLSCTKPDFKCLCKYFWRSVHTIVLVKQVCSLECVIPSLPFVYLQNTLYYYYYYTVIVVCPGKKPL